VESTADPGHTLKPPGSFVVRWPSRKMETFVAEYVSVTK
jgi:hypothetical protein